MLSFKHATQTGAHIFLPCSPLDLDSWAALFVYFTSPNGTEAFCTDKFWLGIIYLNLW